MDAVVISSPYRGEDCRAGAGQQVGALARVKKVVSCRIDHSLSSPISDGDAGGVM